MPGPTRLRPAAGERPAVLAALILLVPGSPATAADPPGYLVEYRAYNAALGSGDTAAAVQHGRAAWQEAETELGDDRLTAILAYNYGKLVVFDDPAKAIAPLERAHSLMTSGVADFAADELGLYMRYAAFAAEDMTRREADRLREALSAFPLDGPDLNPDVAAMWLRLAAYDAREERYRTAGESAAMAEQAISATAIASAATHALAEAILIQAVAHLAPYPRRVADVQRAHNDIIRALALFGPQESIDDFDPVLAKVLAWRDATNAALHTLGRDDYPDHEDAARKDSERRPIFAHQQSVDCPDLEWAERPAPRYPRRALRKGYIGAAYLGYRLGEDGRVYDARVLAEVPQAMFGEAALESVKDWRVDKVPEADPVCLRNLTTSILFIIDN